MADKKMKPAALFADQVRGPHACDDTGTPFFNRNYAEKLINDRDAAVRADERAKVVEEIVGYLHTRIDTDDDLERLLELPADVEHEFGGKPNA